MRGLKHWVCSHRKEILIAFILLASTLASAQQDLTINHTFEQFAPSIQIGYSASHTSVIGTVDSRKIKRDTGFGSSNSDANALECEVFYITPNDKISSLPDFSNLTFAGFIYAKSLNVGQQSPNKRFLGLNKSAWFALRYGGKFNIEKDGFYKFRLASDDGSRLILDGVKVIDNDGIHPFASKGGLIYLDKGTHEVEVDYFQAKDDVGLQLFVTPPGGSEILFAPKYGAEDAYAANDTSYSFADVIRLNDMEIQNNYVQRIGLADRSPADFELSNKPIDLIMPGVEPFMNCTEWSPDSPESGTSDVQVLMGIASKSEISENTYDYKFYTKPGGALIKINGTKYGSSPGSIKLNLGHKYEYTIEKTGYNPFNGTIQGPKDSPIEAHLEPRKKAK